MKGFEAIVTRIQTTQPNVTKISPIMEQQDVWSGLDSFEGLPTISTLLSLSVRNTQISTFYATKEQPSLEKFSCKNTPLGQCKYIALMAAVVFGDQLRIVNRISIPPAILDLSKRTRELLRPLLIDKWIVTSLNPIRLMNIETRKRKTLFVENADISGKKLSNNAQTESQQKLSPVEEGAIMDGKSVCSHTSKILSDEPFSAAEIRQSVRNMMARVVRQREESKPKDISEQRKVGSVNRGDDGDICGAEK